MNRWIYLDNAATTPLKHEVLESMEPYFENEYGNPSAFSVFSQEPRNAVRRSRAAIASFLNAKPEEIFFTGGGTESDNWALKAAAFANAEKGKHIITSKIEHHAILNTCAWLEKAGFEISCINVDENGIIDPDELRRAIRPDTILISVMFANNEIGTIEPVKEIGQIARENGIIFHTDAVQAYGHIPIDVDEYGIDMLSASAHKINGPKGVGILYIRNGIRIGSFIHGGSQERGRRAGTYNTPGIVGFGKATELASSSISGRAAYESELRDHLIMRILDGIPDTKLNGPEKGRLPNNANICFSGIEAESMLVMLDRAGICASAGSACASGSLEPSHVLLAIGLSDTEAASSLRFTLSEDTTKEDIDYVADELKNIAEILRGRKPFRI